MGDVGFEYTVDMLTVASKLNGAKDITSEINWILIHDLPMRYLRKVYPKILEAELKYEDKLNNEYHILEMEKLSEED